MEKLWLAALLLMSTARAPAIYRVQFETTKGSFLVQVTRAWAPRGADRFYELVRSGFYDDSRVFRVRPGFIAQFGIAGNPRRNARWTLIADDPVRQSNVRGTVAFAMTGPDTRLTPTGAALGSRLSALGPARPSVLVPVLPKSREPRAESRSSK